MATDALLLDLYGCVTEPLRWPRMLDRLCGETGACSAVVQGFKLEGSRLHAQWSVQDSRTRGNDALYRSRISDEGNPRLDADRALRGLNRIARDEDLFDSGDSRRLRLTEQLATMGLGRFAGSLQRVNSTTFVGLALHRPVGDRSDFSAAQIARLSGVLPHIAQAVEIGGHLQTASDAEMRIGHQFDGLRCGMLICTAGADVRWMNRSAEVLLESGSSLRLHAGSLRAHTLEASRLLAREIADVARDDAQGRVRYLSFGQGAQALHLAIQPLANACASPGATASVLLLLTGAMAGGVPSQALARLFGLTPVESLLAEAVIAGQTLEQYAQHRGVSVGTVRGQFKQVQAKTGASRQSELVRLALSSAAAQVNNARLQVRRQPSRLETSATASRTAFAAAEFQSAEKLS